jgi:hypothetical protein
MLVRAGENICSLAVNSYDQPIKSCEKMFKLFWMKWKVKEQIFGQYIAFVAGV